MLSTLSLGMVLLLLLILILPYSYTASANLGTNSVKGYDGPVNQLIARVTSHSVLTQIANDAGLAAPLGVGGHMAGSPVDPAERLFADVKYEGRPGEVERLTMTVKGETEEGARDAAQLLAERLVAFDRQLRKLTLSERARGEDPSARTGKPASVQLEELRQRNPLLRDTGLTERFQREASSLTDEEIAIASARLKVDGYEAKARGLEKQVRDEAAAEYAAHRVEEARKRAREAMEARRAAERDAREEEQRSGHAAKGPSVSTLEEQLNELLSRYTRQHPSVRQMLRRIEMAKDNAAAEPAAAEPDTRPIAEPEESRPIADDPRTLLIADDDEDMGPAPAEVPSFWLQKAPSYMLWVDAKNQAVESRLLLSARERTYASHKAKHDGLGKKLQSLEKARVQEQRLLNEIQDEKLLRNRAQDLAPLHRPLLLGQQARIVDSVSPWRLLPFGLFLVALAALLAGFAGELQDRSFHLAAEIRNRAKLPVLGVIPHLRKR